MSYSLVTVALGAFDRSQLLNSLRFAANCARYNLTDWLLKSIFAPRTGFVLGLVVRGSPLSCTTALELSTSGPWLTASAFAFGRGEPPTPNAITPNPIEENISS